MSENKINDGESVNQADLEPQTETSNFTAKFDGFDNETTPQEVVETSTEEVEENNEVVAEEEVFEALEEEPKEVDNTVSENEEVIDLETEDVIEAPSETEPANALPEWVQKMVDFHQETGGGLNEYQLLNKDFDSLDDTQLLREYYKNTKPGYSAEDIDLVLETRFGTEEVEEGEEMSREDKLKVLALKDEVSNAKQFLNQQKQKYYADLKSGVLGAPEQYKDAVQFYNDYQNGQKHQKATRDAFISQSKKLFNEEFQGFQFSANDKSYRLKVGNAEKVMNNQLDINNVLGGFMDDKGNVTDTAGYHKALWAAQNADKLFNAGVEAGKASVIKERAQETKNPSYSNEGQSTPPSQGPSIRFLNND